MFSMQSDEWSFSVKEIIPRGVVFWRAQLGYKSVSQKTISATSRKVIRQELCNSMKKKVPFSMRTVFFERGLFMGDQTLCLYYPA